MSDTYTGVHIGVTAAYGVGGLLSCLGLWVITSEQRKKNEANSIMDHDHYAAAPVWMGFVFSWILMMIVFIWYMFDGTLATLLGHEPPAFGDSGDNPQYWYEGLYLAFSLAVTAVPTGVQAFRHCITVGPTSGLVAMTSLLSVVVTIARFQVKSSAFFWTTYVFICVAFLAVNFLIALMSNLTPKGVFMRIGALMGAVLVGFYGYVAMDMIFGFWYRIWVPYQAVVLQAVWSTLFGYLVVGIAVGSQSKNIAELEARIQRGATAAVERATGNTVSL